MTARDSGPDHDDMPDADVPTDRVADVDMPADDMPDDRVADVDMPADDMPDDRVAGHFDLDPTLTASVVGEGVVDGGSPEMALAGATRSATATATVAGPPVGRKRSLLGASATPAMGTALSRGTGLLRVAALTAALGLTSVADTYNLANSAPNILYELVLGGVLSSTLVPLFIHANDDPDDDSASVIVTVSFVAITILSVLAVLLAPFISQIFSISLHGAAKVRQERLGTMFLALLMPQILFYGITTVLTAPLHARRRFAAPAFTPVLTNLITAGAAVGVWWLVSTGRTDDSSNLAVYLLALGTTLGVAAMAIPLVPAVRRAGIDLRWRFRPRHPVVRKVLRLSGWTVGFAASNQIAYLIVLTIARGVSPGAVSAYNYAFIFFQLPYGLIAVSIMTAVLPELAEAAKAHDVIAFRERFREGLSVLLTFLLPAAGAFLFLGVPLIRILLERGQFTAADTRLTAEMLAGFSLGLPSFAIFMYCVRAFYSRRNTRTPFWLNLFENVLNLVLIVPLVGLVGTWGLALANSVAYFVASILAVVVLNRHVHGTLTLRGLSAFARGLVVAVVVTAVVFVVFLAVRHHVGPLLQIVLALAAALPVFLGLTFLLRPHGFEDTLDTLAEGVRRRTRSLRR